MQAGSGKSTLMKYICDHERTVKALKQWAAPAELCTAQYFFWNQGHDLEKTQVGLLRSIVYQILRSIPELMDIVHHERIEHEDWDVRELQTVLGKIAQQDKLEVKFCFFIDGLDEYDGEEEDLCDILKELALSNDFKVCASTRPRRVFDKFFVNQSRTLDIADFTKDDIRIYVRTKLQNDENFKRLEKIDSAYTEVVNSIVNLAQGVWLWVYLVSIDIKHALNRDEKVGKLQEIVLRFPANLEAYFERMIKAVRPHFREDMAQIFLIVVDELQPLPLYALSLLDQERSDPNHAISHPISRVDEVWLKEQYPAWKSWVNNRCSDLLIVDDQPHPVFLHSSVDFLHRTVRDFLQDSYYEQLKANLKGEFCSTASLAKMCLVLLKSLPVDKFRDHVSLNRIISLTDEILYYAHETEKKNVSLETDMVAILDEVDRVNSHYARAERLHWTHARDPPTDTKFSKLKEGGHCNFLALTIQARLVKYVQAKLQADPGIMKKRGRPLLDYALRPRRTTPISMPYYSQRDDPSVSTDMVQLLLEHGTDPNQAIYLNDGRTIWASFLLSCYETSFSGTDGPPIQKTTVSLNLLAAWYKACELLVEYGARTDCVLERTEPKFTAEYALSALFGDSKMESLRKSMEKKDEERRTFCVTM
jgi:hypothetical protein